MKRWIVLLLASLMPIMSMAQVNALPPAPHLLVKGHAEGRYVPDRFTIKLRVEVVNKVPEQARAKVEGYMQRIFMQLDKCGAVRKLTQASSLSITPEMEYRDQKSVFVGTKVSRSIQTTFDDLDKARSFIAQLQASEEVQILSTEVARSDIDKIRNELRQRAITNSQETAAQMAKAYGLNIKGVYSVSEVAPDFAYGIRAGSWDGSGSMGPIIVSANALPDVDLRVGTIDAEQDIYAVYLTGN